ncbi:MAG TPA: VWA domain-containing protein, partial [Anaerolineae bacterium]
MRPQPETGSNANIWIMNADGTNQTQLAFLDGDVRQPALSPDGKRIAYVYQGSGSERRLYVMNSDGSNLMQLPITGNSQIPVWSPDGSQIALQNDSDDWWEVWIVNAGGSNPHRITTHSEAAGSPSWSPDGQRLVYLSEPTAFYHDLYIINSDGTGQVLLSSAFATGYSHHRPAWSPDGTQIATIRYTAGTLGPYDLWVMNSDGSNGKVIVQAIDNYVVNRLSWSPDGSSLIFSKNGQVWSVKRDGTQLTQITTTGGWEPSIGPGLAACQPQANESDIVLVLDRSGSMGSDNKLNDAKSAIATFLSSTNAPPDQVSLVSFADAATLDQLLTTNKAAVNAAAQALVASGTTRIDLALLVARTELASERHIATHAKIIILLTDGQQNPAGNDPVLAEANAAKAEGAIIYTIGLGPDADAALLQQIATSPGHYYFAPTSAQLDDIYRQISAAITCPDIGGQVYVDKDNNSQYTPGTDTALAGVIINMSGSATGQAVSQVDGSYRFADNFPGTYTLTLNLTNVPPGYAPIAPTNYVVNLTVSDDLDNHFGFRRVSGHGSIVFVRPQPMDDGNSNSDVWIMNADGTNQVQLTTNSGADRWPAISPDGSKVAYVSYRNGLYQLWMMNSDGSNLVQLPVGSNTQMLAWSPDGSQIALTNDSVDWWEIWVMNADGTNLRRL